MESKTPLVFKLKKQLTAYFKEHDLDPSKDYTRDKVHGEFISDLVFKLNRERDKLQRDKIYEDIHSKYKKLVMSKEKKEKKALAQDLKKKKGTDVKSKVESGKAKAVKEDAKAAKEEAKAKVAKATKYDYPLVDGKPMTAEQKKKYRAEQRKKSSAKDQDANHKVNKKVKPEKEKKAKSVKKKDLKDED